MLSRRSPKQILNSALEKARVELKKDNAKEFLTGLNEKEIGWLKAIAAGASNQKAVLAVLITSLVKKTVTPSQDIRLHQSKMKGGYSGRTLDTAVVSPFMRRNFQKYSMKESGWLTRSLEQPVPFTLDFQGEIQNKNVKDAFLNLLDSIQEKNADPERYLVALFVLLENKLRITQTLLTKVPRVAADVPIENVVNLLKQHFSQKYDSYGASKLPVIAIYSIYQIMMKELARFKSKKLLPLKSHVTADIKAKSLGDVEVVDENGDFFEVVEIKLGIPIGYDMVKTTYDEKIEDTKVNRYYILTSAEPYLIKDEKDDIMELVNQIREKHGCEIILNGLIPSIKYYLRLIRSTKDFLDRYNENLKNEISTSSEIKEEHLKAWIRYLESLKK